MSSDAKKLKDYITKLKEHVDNWTEDRSDRAIVLLLLAEISLRGVVVANLSFLEKNDHWNTGAIHGLFDQIISIAGKAVLDESSCINFPTPLIAGAFLIAGTVAEKVTQVLLHKNENQSSLMTSTSIFQLLNPTLNLIDTNVLNNVLQRCDDVNDYRFKALISILFTSMDIPWIEVAAIFMRVSVGNMIYAAFLSNPEVPVMWKRSLDSILVMHKIINSIHRHHDNLHNRNKANTTDNRMDWKQLEIETYDSYHNTDAIIPLQKLISIALLKGNKKRAVELRLHLVESILSGLRFISTNVHKSYLLSDSGKKQWTLITSAFWRDPCTNTNLLQDILSAKETLQQFSKDVSEGDFAANDTMLLLYKHLKLRIELAHEDYIVSSIAEQRRVAYKNRTAGMGGGLSTTGTKQDEWSTFLLTARKDILADTLSKDEYDPKIFSQYGRSHVAASALALRDALLSLSEFGNLKNELYKAASYSLCTYMSQLILKAQAINTRKVKRESFKLEGHQVWIDLMKFSAPIISYFSQNQHNFVDRSSLEDSHIIECAAQSYTAAHWMCINGLVDVNTDHMDACSSLLSSLFDNHRKWLLEKKKIEEAADLIKSISAKTQTIADIELEISQAASRAYCVLIQITQTETLSDHHSKMIEASTKETLEIIKKISMNPAITQATAKFGFSFAQLLICWSGLHTAGWPFCTVLDARSIVRYVKSSVTLLYSEWGRDLSDFESMLLLLAEADCECLPGGFAPEAITLYTQMIEIFERSQTAQNQNHFFILLKSHAMLGLTALKLGSKSSQGDSVQEANEMATRSLGLLQQIKESASDPIDKFYAFDHKSFDKILQYNICTSRQLVAETLLRQHNFTDAHEFLVQAAKEAAANFQVAFDLASFTLRMSLYNSISSFGSKQVSQILLLKATKLDNEKADPYALLGIFYEVQLDQLRAFGFYSKALIADPSHPVAGRGILRLKGYEEVKQLCEVASSISSPVNGWAWLVIGRAKSLHGDDPGAILCFQQALRCKDIDSPDTQKLEVFFGLPRSSNDQNKSVSEKTMVWSSLAACYRRIGKHSAALRAYRSALESSYEPSSNVLCEMAQVLLDLGIVQEAEQKFRMAFASTNDESLRYICRIGVGRSLLDRARFHLLEGKLGLALSQLVGGLEMLKDNNGINISYFICAERLCGDLHTFGSLLPDSVFNDQKLNKLEFIAEGEKAYQNVLTTLMALSSFDNVLIADVYSDLGTNILLQSRSLIEMCQIGQGTPEAVERLLNRSIEFFSSAIDIIDHDSARAWNGIGCALSLIDPVLAQHAFCRALEIDNSFSDSWANIGLLYLRSGYLIESSYVFEMLTQVESPILWLGKAYLFVEKALSEQNKSLRDGLLKQGAEAYRASLLQGGSNSLGLLGLSTTRRKTTNVTSHSNNQYYGAERLSYLHTYFDLNGKKTVSAAFSGGLMMCEKGLYMLRNSSYHIARDEVSHGLDELLEATKTLEKLGNLHGNTSMKSLVLQDSVELVKKQEDLHSIYSSCQQILSPLLDDNYVAHRIQSLPHPSHSVVTSQKNLLLSTWEGLLWLQLAEKLVIKVTSLQNPCRNIIDAAFTATTKAMRLLNAKSIAKNCSSELQVTGCILSQCLALSAWIGLLYNQNNTHDCVYDIQRALIFDPENRAARLWLTK